MGLNRDSNWENRKQTRLCCCTKQPHITSEDVTNLVKHPEYHLRNLPETYRDALDGLSSFDIREMFHDSKVPFRYAGCPRGAMTCCCSCTRLCNKRCPQDVLNRAYISCAYVLDARTPEEYDERYAKAPTPVQMLCKELQEETPRYFAIAAMVSEMMSPQLNKQLERTMAEVYGNEDSPYKFDYAAAIEYEEYYVTHPNGYTETKLRKKVDPTTGEVSILHWPRSGMCPYCLPTGLMDRRRTVGNKKRRTPGKQQY